MVTTRRQSLAARGEPRREAGWVRQPCEQKPPFTVGQLRKAIPAHCWQRSAWRSGAYLLLDVLMLAALVYASSFIDAAPVPSYVKWGLLWPLYWFFAGGVGTGCWVRGPERLREAVASLGQPLVGLGRAACISAW